jgi:hypothetical protein
LGTNSFGANPSGSPPDLAGSRAPDCDSNGCLVLEVEANNKTFFATLLVLLRRVAT